MVRAVGYALGCGVVWLGCALAGGRWVRRIARYVLRGRAAMDAGNELGPEGAASLAPALEKMLQLTSLELGGARIRVGARPRGAGAVGGGGLGGRGFGACLWLIAWMRCVVVGVRACRRAMRVTVCKVCAEGRGGDGCRQ